GTARRGRCSPAAASSFSSRCSRFSCAEAVRMPDPADTARRAADALIAYWTRAPGQDMLTRDLCRRLAEAVERDSPVPLAGLVEADPGRGAGLAHDAVRIAAERSPAVRGLCVR